MLHAGGCLTQRGSWATHVGCLPGRPFVVDFLWLPRLFLPFSPHFSLVFQSFKVPFIYSTLPVPQQRCHSHRLFRGTWTMCDRPITMALARIVVRNALAMLAIHTLWRQLTDKPSRRLSTFASNSSSTVTTQYDSRRSANLEGLFSTLTTTGSHPIPHLSTRRWASSLD